MTAAKRRETNTLVTNRLRYTRVKLLAVAGIAAMLAFMLPPAAAKPRSFRTRIKPAYPELARLLGIAGTVKLALTVDCVGRVVEVSPLSGEPLLMEAAEEVARLWRFTSGTGTARVDVEVDFPPAG